MHPSRFLPAISLLACSVIVDASPLAMLEGRAVGLVPRQKTPDDECRLKPPVSAEYDFSYYTFHISAEVKDAAAAAGLTKIGVRQYCNSNGGPGGFIYHGTENWAYVPLDKFGKDNPYKVKVNRCKKDFDRHVLNYSVWLCDENNWCGTTNCGRSRKICPEKRTKSVDLIDDKIWLCGA